MHTCIVTQAFFGKSEAVFGHFQLDYVRGASVHPTIIITEIFSISRKGEEPYMGGLDNLLESMLYYLTLTSL